MSFRLTPRPEAYGAEERRSSSPLRRVSFESVLAGGANPDGLIWECPAIDGERHLTALILQLGPHTANLVLRDPSQVVVLETLRSGLKAAPMKQA